MIPFVKEGVLLPAIFSVADPKMLSWIPYPDFFSIPDHGSLILRHGSNARKKQQGTNKWGVFLFCSFSLFQIESYFFTDTEKDFSQLTKSLRIFNHKKYNRAFRNMGWILDPEQNWSRTHGFKKHRVSQIRGLDPQHWLFSYFVLCFNFLYLVWVYIRGSF